MSNAIICITLGSGNEFGISDSSMFIMTRAISLRESDIIIDLGPATRENFRQLIKNLNRLEIHMKDE